MQRSVTQSTQGASTDPAKTAIDRWAPTRANLPSRVGH